VAVKKRNRKTVSHIVEAVIIIKILPVFLKCSDGAVRM